MELKTVFFEKSENDSWKRLAKRPCQVYVTKGMKVVIEEEYYNVADFFLSLDKNVLVVYLEKLVEDAFIFTL